MDGRLFIFSAPSGSGKTTLVRWLMETHPELGLSFSVSCTTRAPRGTERDGVDYYFLTEEAFREKIRQGAFVEYEEVYKGRLYGTLHSEVEAQLERGINVVFDVDVVGGCNIKRQYGPRAVSIFVKPPSINELRRRLVARGTDSAEMIENRLAKAETELSYAKEFDHVVVNDDLHQAQEEVLQIVRSAL